MCVMRFLKVDLETMLQPKILYTFTWIWDRYQCPMENFSTYTSLSMIWRWYHVHFCTWQQYSQFQFYLSSGLNSWHFSVRMLLLFWMGTYLSWRTFSILWFSKVLVQKCHISGDLPGGPVIKRPYSQLILILKCHTPNAGPWVQSLVRELDPTGLNSDLGQPNKWINIRKNTTIFPNVIWWGERVGVAISFSWE